LRPSSISGARRARSEREPGERQTLQVPREPGACESGGEADERRDDRGKDEGQGAVEEAAGDRGTGGLAMMKAAAWTGQASNAGCTAAAALRRTLHAIIVFFAFLYVSTLHRESIKTRHYTLARYFAKY